MKIIKILILALILFSCEKEKDYETFTTPKGSHYSQRDYDVNYRSSVKFSVSFDESCIYDIGSNQSDWNKLFGFSTGNSHHHENSVRIAWRWFEYQLQMGWYTYIDGERDYKLITDIPLNEFIECEVSDIGIGVDGNYIELPDLEKVGVFSYQLFPYFGGDMPAPHDINIKFKWL